MHRTSFHLRCLPALQERVGRRRKRWVAQLGRLDAREVGLGSLVWGGVVVVVDERHGWNDRGFVLGCEAVKNSIARKDMPD